MVICGYLMAIIGYYINYGYHIYGYSSLLVEIGDY
jgi:hypothetical protein